MYLLKKCAEKGCKRSGSVAINQTDKFCNIHLAKGNIDEDRTEDLEKIENQNNNNK